MNLFISKQKLAALLIGLLTLSSVITYAQKPTELRLIGHRGGAHEYEENTLQAFKETYAQGIRAYETDIRITKDGELVILHDSSLEHMTGNKAKVEELSSGEIKKLKTKKGNPILFLDEFLDFFKDKKGVYIELEMKTNNPLYDEATLEKYCDKLYSKAMSKRAEGSEYLFTSFDKRPLKLIKSKYPTAELMYIKSEGLTDALLLELEEMQVKRVACRTDLTTRQMVRKAQGQGVKITLWPTITINDYLLALALGGDNICTDIPLQVKQYSSKNFPWVTIK